VGCLIFLLEIFQKRDRKSEFMWYDLSHAVNVITEVGLSDSKKIAEILTNSHFRNDILALADPTELKRLADAHAASGTKTSFFDYYMSNRYREGAVVEVKSGTSGNWVRSLNDHPQNYAAGVETGEWKVFSGRGQFCGWQTFR
jgi:hypothetical protein